MTTLLPTLTYGPAQFEAARRLATKAHALQTRADGKTPYITHPEAVAELFRYYWLKNPTWAGWVAGRPESDMWRGMVLSLLHDTVEDTDIAPTDFVHAGLGNIVPEVNLLTRAEDETYLSYLLAIKIYRQTSILPWLVKLCDIEHNQSDVEGLPYERRKHARVKYELAFYILTHS